MALIDADTWIAATAVTPTGADLTALSAICAQVSAALARRLLPYVAEPLTATAIVMDAPVSELLATLRPLRSITSIYYRSDANGDTTLFTSDYLLAATNNLEYLMEVDDPVTGWSRAGLIRRTGARVWGYRGVRALGTLAPRLASEPKSLLLTYTYGETSVPADIQAAAISATTLLYARRKTGAPYQSESWGGYSYSNAGPYTAEGAINTPDVKALLAPYILPKFA